MPRRLFFLVTGLLLAAAVLAAFAPCFRAGFVNLDDDRYLTDNPDVQKVTARNLGRLFSTYYVACYVPVTMLTFTAEHALFGLWPGAYHATNILLHLVNALLVFFLGTKLLRLRPGGLTREGAIWLAGAIGAFLFALHPLRVECVAWVSARKDVLYAAFYLGALIVYLGHVQAVKPSSRGSGPPVFPRPLITALVLFVLSFFSKPMAITLPVVFVLIDLWAGRRIDRRMLLEKSPFFLLALVFSWVTYTGQKAGGAMEMAAPFTLAEKVLIAGHGVVLYLWKMAAPFGLSVLYPFPTQVPGWFAYAPVLLLALGCGLWALRRRFPLVLFGGAFFLGTIFPVLKLVPIGEAIIADRYTYLPCIGLGLPLGAGAAWLWERARPRGFRPLLAALLAAVLAALGFLTWQRCAVWRSSFTLYEDTIAKGGGNATVYTNLSNAYLSEKNLPAAIEAATRAISLKPEWAAPWGNRALARLGRKEYDLAIADYTAAIEKNPAAGPYYHNRGEAYLQTGQYEKVIPDCDRAIALEGLAISYFNRAVAQANLGRDEGALQDLTAALRKEPGLARARFFRARLLIDARAYAEAWSDLKTLQAMGMPADPAVIDLIPERFRR